MGFFLPAFHWTFSAHFLCHQGLLLIPPTSSSYSVILKFGEQSKFRSSIAFSRPHPTFVSVSPRSSAKSRSLFASWAQWTRLLCYPRSRTLIHIRISPSSLEMAAFILNLRTRHAVIKKPTKCKKETQWTIQRSDMTAGERKWTHTLLIRAHLIKN